MTALGSTQTELLAGRKYAVVAGSGGAVVQLKPRGQGMPFPLTLVAGQSIKVLGEDVEYLLLTSGAAEYYIGAEVTAQGSAALSLVDSVHQYIMELAGAGPFTLSGVNIIPKGTLVRYNLTTEWNLADASGPDMELVGATSGIVYASAAVGNVVSGSVRWEQAELLQLAWSNLSGASKHVFSGHAGAWSGE